MAFKHSFLFGLGKIFLLSIPDTASPTFFFCIFNSIKLGITTSLTLYIVLWTSVDSFVSTFTHASVVLLRHTSYLPNLGDIFLQTRYCGITYWKDGNLHPHSHSTVLCFTVCNPVGRVGDGQGGKAEPLDCISNSYEHDLLGISIFSCQVFSNRSRGR